MLNKLLEAEELAFLAELMAKESDDNPQCDRATATGLSSMPAAGAGAGLS